MTRPTVLAAGGVLWRHDPADPEVALVHRPQYDDWSLPKGKAKAGEHLIVTALRETTEETGQAARIGPYLSTVRYRVSAGGRLANKVVTYWSMRSLGGTFAPDREVDKMEWLGLRSARSRLTSASDRAVLSTFERATVDTHPLLLVRNGPTASSPRRVDRPRAPVRLNRSGRDLATGLVPVLRGLGVTDLRSSDLPACAETLMPYAVAAGLTVRLDERLTRSAFAGNERAVADELRQAASAGQVPATCAQQKVLIGLLGALGHTGGVRPPHDTSVVKGGWWLLHHRGGDVTAYERHG